MYRYDEFDAQFVGERVAQFRDQVARRLTGELTEDQFKLHRLMNGVYLQLHAYMLRVAIPYGVLSSRQLRKLAHIARRYDKGFGHFTTRQNIQYNWPALADCPDILDELASVEMHAIQTSGNCIRNVTADQFAGAAADEVADPRPYAEILRQWSSLHPEYSFLPRKFKIAVTGAPKDRAAIQVHDIGYHVIRNDQGEIGFAVYVGGGQGRTPMVALKIRDFLPEAELLAYTDAIVRVYNLEGRRDNKYKARIKILVHEKGAGAMRTAVEAEFAKVRERDLTLPETDIQAIQSYFALPALHGKPASSDAVKTRRAQDQTFDRFVAVNVTAHKVSGYGVVTISLKPIGGIPGDATAEQMDLVADLAERYSQDEIRVSHEQNLVLPHIALDDLPAVYDALAASGLATANAGLVTDIIACPGLDYCALATARSIPVAQRISERFGDSPRAQDIGDLKIKISGCINACGHHHVGHIGILGLERKGEETYQITLGGSADETCSLGTLTGPGFSSEDVVDAVETVVNTYMNVRRDRSEDFLSTFRRVGMTPFKQALYEKNEGRRDLTIMGALDVNLFGDLSAASRFEERFVALDARAVLRLAIKDLFPGRIALVSSFGADSAVLLHMISTIDKATPVIFVDSGHLFPETLAYRDELTALLGLSDVRSVSATPEELATLDPESFLWSSDPDRCCAIRKVAPLGRAIEGFDAWITGRKRFQADTRSSLPLFETEGERVKINPLAGWDATKLLAYLDEHELPRHRMVARGYPSIGCIPCTSAVKPGEDPRAGRWRGKGKIECGIHLGVVSGGAGI